MSPLRCLQETASSLNEISCGLNGFDRPVKKTIDNLFELIRYPINILLSLSAVHSFLDFRIKN